MSQRLKRWESPRRQGRNDKGKGGSARQRQKRKQLKALRQKLKETGQEHSLDAQFSIEPKKGIPPFFFMVF